MKVGAFVNYRFFNLEETPLLFVLLPKRVNFSQMEINGNHSEKTYRKPRFPRMSRQQPL